MDANLLFSHHSGNGLSHVRRQAITWTNADPFRRCICVAREGDEFNTFFITCRFFWSPDRRPSVPPWGVLDGDSHMGCGMEVHAYQRQARCFRTGPLIRHVSSKWLQFCRRHSEMHFHNGQSLYCESNLNWFCCEGIIGCIYFTIR